jgi:ATP-dependent protease ClpP protease subunit
MAEEHLYINGYIGEVFDPFGDGNNFTVKQLNEFLSTLPADTEVLNVHINSGGGSVTEGFAIHDILATLPYKVITIVEGLCGSIATVIAMAGSERKMYENSEYFIHNPLWIPSAPDAHTADDLDALRDELKKAELKLVDFYYKNTKATKSDLIAKMKAETTLTAQEAKDLGFITEIINTKVKAMVKYNIAAYIDKPKNNENMSEVKDFIAKGNGVLAKIEGLIAKLGKGKIVNATATLEDGKTIYYDGELAVGTAVWLDEAMTQPAPDGTHVLADGSSIVTAGGLVTDIMAVKVDETAAIKAELEATKKELEAAKTENDTLKAEKAQVNETVAEVQKELVAMKKALNSGNGGNFATPPVNSKDQPPAKPKSTLDIAAERAKAKYKL